MRSVKLVRDGQEWVVRTRYPAMRIDARTMPLPLTEAKKARRERRVYVALLACNVAPVTARRLAAGSGDDKQAWYGLVGRYRAMAERENAISERDQPAVSPTTPAAPREAFAVFRPGRRT